MRASLLLFMSYLAQFLSLLCVCLILIPLLFPITATLCGITIATTFFSSYLSKKIESEFLSEFQKKLLEKTRKGNQRANWLSCLALGISFLLYGILRLHISVCYVDSLDRELEPRREDLRKILRPQQGIDVKESKKEGP